MTSNQSPLGTLIFLCPIVGVSISFLLAWRQWFATGRCFRLNFWTKMESL
jgi:hypothetical protein